jgi:uncharacterized protein (DUF4415 family)
MHQRLCPPTSATPPGRKCRSSSRRKSVPVDADVLAWFQNEAEPAGWQDHINGVLRFYMETNMG